MQFVRLSPEIGGLEVKREDGRRLAIMPLEHLQAALGTDIQQQFRTAFRTGALSWPSPFDGSAVACNRSFALSDFQYAYRFTDPLSGLDWFILASDHICRALALWLPALDILVTSPGQEAAARGSFANLASMVVEHLAQYGDVLDQAPRQSRFAVPIRGLPGMHMGHLLWNELSAIEPLIAELPHHRLPEWLVVSAAQGTEIYGPLDALYPELSGIVNRSLDDMAAMIRWGYTEGAHIVRVNSNYVSAALRTRILAHVRARSTNPPPPPAP